MTSTTSTTSTQTPLAKPAFASMTANEWGQITDLEPHAQYFVVKRPALVVPKTREEATEKGKELVTEVKSFLHEHKVLTQKQLGELKERYAGPAVDKAREVREMVEKRFDEAAREIEARYEKLERDIEQNLDRVFKNGKKTNGEGSDSGAETKGAGAASPSTVTAETPGELPRGDAPPEAPTAETASTDEANKAESKPKKKAAAQKTE